MNKMLTWFATGLALTLLVCAASRADEKKTAAKDGLSETHTASKSERQQNAEADESDEDGPKEHAKQHVTKKDSNDKDDEDAPKPKSKEAKSKELSASDKNGKQAMDEDDDDQPKTRNRQKEDAGDEDESPKGMSKDGHRKTKEGTSKLKDRDEDDEDGGSTEVRHRGALVIKVDLNKLSPKLAKELLEELAALREGDHDDDADHGENNEKDRGKHKAAADGEKSRPTQSSKTSSHDRNGTDKADEDDFDAKGGEHHAKGNAKARQGKNEDAESKEDDSPESKQKEHKAHED